MLLYVLVALALCYLAACGALWAAQNRLVFQPGPAPTTEPKDHGLAGQVQLLKTSDGERIYAWIVPADRPRGFAIVCHGNAGNVENRAEYARVLGPMGLTTILFDYRGYGASSGSPSEDGTYLDAEAVYEYAQHALHAEPGQIFLVGESLGGGVAVELALRRPVAGLVLQDAFTSIPTSPPSSTPGCRCGSWRTCATTTWRRSRACPCRS
jgi:pimeloyl-ACP methyl ester carboxylesterase